MHTKAHGHVTAEGGGRDQRGEGGKSGSSVIEKCPDSGISYKIKINFLNEINFKKFLQLPISPVWRTEFYVHRECVIHFLVDRAFFFCPRDLTPSFQ